MKQYALEKLIRVLTVWEQPLQMKGLLVRLVVPSAWAKIYSVIFIGLLSHHNLLFHKLSGRGIMVDDSIFLLQETFIRNKIYY